MKSYRLTVVLIFSLSEMNKSDCGGWARVDQDLRALVHMASPATSTTATSTAATTATATNHHRNRSVTMIPVHLVKREDYRTMALVTEEAASTLPIMASADQRFQERTVFQRAYQPMDLLVDAMMTTTTTMAGGGGGGGYYGGGTFAALEDIQDRVREQAARLDFERKMRQLYEQRQKRMYVQGDGGWAGL